MVPRPRVTIVHELPGRVRFRVEGGAPRRGRAARVWIGQLAGVERARGSPASSTAVLVIYDAAVTTAEAILARVEAVEPAELPELQPEPPTARAEWIKAGLSTAALATATTGILPLPVAYGAVALTAIPPFRRAIEQPREAAASTST